MKLHDLRPAVGAHTRKMRVGRGIAAGGGKTAGRGTKGQKARAGGSIPAWFEGGQTPLHQRIPKLRGFRNPFKIEYEVVNLSRIAALVELGALEPGELPGAAKAGAPARAKSAPITINQEILRAVGAVRTLNKPLKILGNGDVDRPLFVVADKFSRTAVAKIEAAGGSVQVIEIPTGPLAALGIEFPSTPAPAPAPAKASATVGSAATEEAAVPAEAPSTPKARAPEAPAARTRPAKPAGPTAAAKTAAKAAAPAATAKTTRSPKSQSSAADKTVAVPPVDAAPADAVAADASEPSADTPAGEDA
jgi:large subunit ribosomal protein L15